MSKRPAEEPSEDEGGSKAQRMDSPEGGSGGSAGNSGGGGSGGSSKGMAIFPERPLKLTNKNSLHFTKKFYFKIYANDWKYDAVIGGADVTGFMTVIPWQALCMYLAPNEYLDIIRQSNFAKIKQAGLQLKFKAVRTPFDANSTDTAEANGNLQFEICRWDGLEQMMPFKVATVPLDPTITPKLYTTHQELINRLYGTEAIYEEAVRFPAVMRERGIEGRPVWNFRGDSYPNGTGTMYRNMNRAISSLPIGEYVTDCINSNISKMGEGYCFNKTYKPKNGILTMAPSAYNRFNNAAGHTRINQPVRHADTNVQPTVMGDHQYEALYPTFADSGTVITGITATTTQATWFDPGVNHVTGNDGDPTKMVARNPQQGGSEQIYGAYTLGMEAGPHPNQNFSWYWETENPATFAIRDVIGTLSTSTTDNVAAVEEVDNFGYGYQNDMGYYSIANLENYSMHTSRNPPPLHHMPSMMIGAIPKTTKVAADIVQATLEFECTTMIEIEVQNVHPTYMNNSYLPFNDVDIDAGWADSRFETQNLYGGRWQHNETDVLLYDPKHWNNSYGLAGKPLFEPILASAPLRTNPV